MQKRNQCMDKNKLTGRGKDHYLPGILIRLICRGKDYILKGGIYSKLIKKSSRLQDNYGDKYHKGERWKKWLPMWTYRLIDCVSIHRLLLTWGSCASSFAFVQTKYSFKKWRSGGHNNPQKIIPSLLQPTSLKKDEIFEVWGRAQQAARSQFKRINRAVGQARSAVLKIGTNNSSSAKEKANAVESNWCMLGLRISQFLSVSSEVAHREKGGSVAAYWPHSVVIPAALALLSSRLEQTILPLPRMKIQKWDTIIYQKIILTFLS